MRRIALTALAGSSIEWFDFFLYGTAAALVFPTVLFSPDMPPLASLIASWAGEFVNAFVMSHMKMITVGRHLWMRPIGSTAIGQLVHTSLVMAIAFLGSLCWDPIFTLIYSGYLGKVAYEAIATPVTYLVVNGLKRREGVEIFDIATNFNPFAGGLARK